MANYFIFIDNTKMMMLAHVWCLGTWHLNMSFTFPLPSLERWAFIHSHFNIGNCFGVHCTFGEDNILLNAFYILSFSHYHFLFPTLEFLNKNLIALQKHGVDQRILQWLLYTFIGNDSNSSRCYVYQLYKSFLLKNIRAV